MQIQKPEFMRFEYSNLITGTKSCVRLLWYAVVLAGSELLTNCIFEIRYCVQGARVGCLY